MIQQLPLKQEVETKAVLKALANAIGIWLN